MNFLDILSGAAGSNQDANAALNMIAQRQREQSLAQVAGQQAQMGNLDLLQRAATAKVLGDPRFNPQAYDPLAAITGSIPQIAQPQAPAPIAPAPGQPSVPMVQPSVGQAPASPQSGPVASQAAQGSNPSTPNGGTLQPPPLIDVISQILGPNATAQEKGEALQGVYQFLAPQYKQQLAIYAQMMKVQQGQQNIDIRREGADEKVTHDRATEKAATDRTAATRERTGAILQAANIRAATAAANQQLQRDLAAGKITQQKYNAKVNALGKIASDYSRQATAFGASAADIAAARQGFNDTKNQIADLIGGEPEAPTPAPVVSPPPSVGGGSTGYKSAADVTAAYKAGAIDYDAAAKILRDNGWAQ